MGKSIKQLKKEYKEKGYIIREIDASCYKGQPDMRKNLQESYMNTGVEFLGLYNDFMVVACKDKWLLNQFTLRFAKMTKDIMASKGVDVEITIPAKEKLEKEIKFISQFGTPKEKEELAIKRLMSGLEIVTLPEKKKY